MPFQFSERLTVGASTDYKDGYVGCMSSLQVNGETLDLYDKVQNDERFSYGLSLGRRVLICILYGWIYSLHKTNGLPGIVTVHLSVVIVYSHSLQLVCQLYGSGL